MAENTVNNVAKNTGCCRKSFEETLFCKNKNSANDFLVLIERKKAERIVIKISAVTATVIHF